MPPLHPLHEQLTTSLQTRHSLPVDPQWLSTFLASRGANLPPLPALLSTAHFRILASDITTSLSPSSRSDALPEGVDDVNVKERRLDGTVVVQVLDVLDVGSSKWSQVEGIEHMERGEEIRGREVIRSVDVEEHAGTRATTATSNSAANATVPSTGNKKLSPGPHKLLLQDARGTKALAFELVKVPKIGLSAAASASLTLLGATNANANANQSLGAALTAEDPGMFIGCKLLLRPGTVVRRGMIMLTPEECVVLGGKVEAWDKRWKKTRKERLVALVREEDSGGGG